MRISGVKKNATAANCKMPTTSRRPLSGSESWSGGLEVALTQVIHSRWQLEGAVNKALDVHGWNNIADHRAYASNGKPISRRSL
jgi:hypothetical protein